MPTSTPQSAPHTAEEIQTSIDTATFLKTLSEEKDFKFILLLSHNKTGHSTLSANVERGAISAILHHNAIRYQTQDREDLHFDWDKKN